MASRLLEVEFVEDIECRGRGIKRGDKDGLGWFREVAAFGTKCKKKALCSGEGGDISHYSRVVCIPRLDRMRNSGSDCFGERGEG